VLYEMLTGRLPFEGDSAVSVAIQHLSSVPLAPREVNPDIPEQLELICMKAMAPDLEKRYPSADAMIADLEAFRKNPGVNLDFELSDLRPEETDEPTQKLRSAVPPQLHRQGREPSYERGRRWEEDRYEDEQPSRLSGGKKIALIGGGAVVVVVVLFFLFRAIFASFVPAAPDTYTVPKLVGMTEEQANEQASVAAPSRWWWRAPRPATPPWVKSSARTRSRTRRRRVSCPSPSTSGSAPVRTWAPCRT
jgi:serine/threonine protein kinase